MKRARSGFKWIMILTTVVPLLGMGLAFFFVFGNDGCSKAEGSVEASGSPLGDFVMKPNRCKSGQRQGFFGAILTSEVEGQGMKVVQDPLTGFQIQMAVPGSCRGSTCQMVTFGADICSLFDVEVSPTNTTVNDIRVLEGHARFECAFPEGGKVKGDVRFKCD